MFLWPHKSYELDHSLDEVQPYADFSTSNDDGESVCVGETAEEKRLRYRSHWVVHSTMCIFSIGFSIVISGVFPYLKLLQDDEHLSKTYLGWVIAITPVGMIISSPVIGRLANQLGSIRMTCVVAMVIFTIANVAYGLLPSFIGLWRESAFHVMLVARLLVGLSSGLIVLCRSYLAGATTLSERTDAFSMLAAAQSLGYIIGPVLQMVLSLILKDDFWKYQATGFISVALGIINLFLMTPYVFTEFDIAAQERDLMKKKNTGNHDRPRSLKPDMPALLAVMLAYFLASLIYILIETLLEPLAQDQYAWCDNLAVIVVGVILSATGVIFLVMFVVAARLAKIFDERKLLLYCGIGVTVLGLLAFLPWSSTPLKYCSKTEVAIYQAATNESLDTSIYSLIEVHHLPHYERQNNTFVNSLFESYCSDDLECLGCPPHQTWCQDVPQLPFGQLLVAFIIILAMFPISISMTSSLFSKMLGPVPQGTWMGWFSAVGSLARMLGPIFVSYVYSYLGTRYTFGILTILIVVGGVQLLYFYERIVPLTRETPPITTKQRTKEQM